MRPIDADAIRERHISVARFFKALENGKKFTKLIGVLVKRIDEAPTLDYVPRQQWISVKDRLPELDADGTIPAVFVTDGEFIHMAYFSHNNWFFCESGEMKENMFYVVSHWMPLPEPPKEE